MFRNSLTPNCMQEIDLGAKFLGPEVGLGGIL